MTVVVCSPAYFARRWTNYELIGILERSHTLGEDVIIPIWYNIDKAGVGAYSWPLTGMNAYTNRGEAGQTSQEVLDHIAGELVKRLGHRPPPPPPPQILA